MRFIERAIAVALVLAWSAGAVAAGQVDDVPAAPPSSAAEASFVLGPPRQAGPVVVAVDFRIHDINDIDDEKETFEFTGIMTLRWRDPRQAFDPAVAGVREKIFQGEYQFNEISPGWYPQVVLINESGLYETGGVVLRVEPDGSSTLVSTINAAAETDFRLQRFPFDEQRLEAVFEVLGFHRDEVVLVLESEANQAAASDIAVPQWAIHAIETSIGERSRNYADRDGVSSAFIVSVEAERNSFYIRRLVVIPLAVIVLLSFSVFWMDRSSLGDRISVSFIGILTGVAYQFVMNDSLPRISYVTLMHGFLNLSFLTMCGTVVINLVVGAYDKRGQQEIGDRIDHRCRWIFPLVYLALNCVIAWVAFTFF